MIPTNLIENHDGSLVTTSLALAEVTGRNHRNILRLIDGHVQSLEQRISEVTELNIELSEPPPLGQNLDLLLLTRDFLAKNILETTYTDPTGRPLRSFEMTKSGFMNVAAALTGVEGSIARALIITRFEEMEEQLLQLQAQYDDHAAPIPIGSVQIDPTFPEVTYPAYIFRNVPYLPKDALNRGLKTKLNTARIPQAACIDTETSASQLLRLDVAYTIVSGPDAKHILYLHDQVLSLLPTKHPWRRLFQANQAQVPILTQMAKTLDRPIPLSQGPRQ